MDDSISNVLTTIYNDDVQILFDDNPVFTLNVSNKKLIYVFLEFNCINASGPAISTLKVTNDVGAQLDSRQFQNSVGKILMSFYLFRISSTNFASIYITYYKNQVYDCGLFNITQNIKFTLSGGNTNQYGPSITGAYML